MNISDPNLHEHYVNLRLQIISPYIDTHAYIVVYDFAVYRLIIQVAHDHHQFHACTHSSFFSTFPTQRTTPHFTLSTYKYRPHVPSLSKFPFHIFQPKNPLISPIFNLFEQQKSKNQKENGRSDEKTRRLYPITRTRPLLSNSITDPPKTHHPVNPTHHIQQTTSPQRPQQQQHKQYY